MRYTAIFKLKTSLEELTAECLALFGEGARPDFEQVEVAFALYNTPVQHGYIRIVVAAHIATALQWMQDNEITSQHADLIRVEWHGQDVVEDAEGNFIEEPFQIGITDVLDEQGTVIETLPRYLGRIG